MLDGVQMQINSFYGKYATKEGITLAEAKKRVTELDIKAYERKAERYVKDASLDRKVNGGKTNTSGYYFSDKANEEMRLYNLTMKVNRLEMLKANIGLELIKGHDELERFMGEILQGRTEEELKRQAGILGKTVLNNAKTAHTIVNASFHNATFSDRIWMYQDLMKADLSKLLQTGLIQGKNPRVLARELKKTFGVSTYNAERLMRTELARVQTEAQKQSFERNGFEMYTFIANSGCCDICKEKDGKHFKVADMMPGENASPMHPHCRCSTAAYSDRKEYDEWLDFLANGGTTEEYNKMEAMRNDADRQARIKARREAYRQRHSAPTQAKPDFSNMDSKQLLSFVADNLKTPFINTKGVNTDFLRESVRVFYEFENKMSGKALDGLKVSFGAKRQTAYASYSAKTNEIYLKKSGSLAKFAEMQQSENARALKKAGKRQHATTDFAGTIWHEIGHAIDHDTGQNMSRSLSATKDLEVKSVKISRYAGSDPALGAPKRSEAWAENFAAYMSGENANEVPAEIVKMIEEYFNKKK
jgi:SPP1 gp7 family putative phage head morphogenesis protein